MSSFNYCYSLVVLAFFKAMENSLILLSTNKQLCVIIIDFDCFPWLFRTNVTKYIYNFGSINSVGFKLQALVKVGKKDESKDKQI